MLPTKPESSDLGAAYKTNIISSDI